ILNTFSYDPIGNLIASTDGKGNTVRYEVNALGQIVRVVRGVTGTTPGFFAEQIYNARDGIVERRVQDFGDTSGTGGVVNNLVTFDMLGQVVEMAQELGGGPFAVTKYRYDPQGHRTAIIFPEGNQFTMQYDERGLIYRLVRGDNDLDASNGGPSGSSLQVYNYDLNGNPAGFVDGRGTSWRFTYDGVDRRVRSEIIPGISFFDIFWNPMDVVQSIAVVEGTTTRHDVVFQYDELGRTVRVLRSIRDATGALIL